MQRRALYYHWYVVSLCTVQLSGDNILQNYKIGYRHLRRGQLRRYFLTDTPKEYILKLEKLDFSPMATKLTYSDLLLFHRIIHKYICINLPNYIKPASFPTNKCNMNTRMFKDSTESFDHLKLISTENPNIAAFENIFFYGTSIKWSSLPLVIMIVNSFD